MDYRIHLNIDGSETSTTLALIKSKVDTLEYAICLLLNEDQKEKVKCMERFNTLTEFIMLFEGAKDYEDNPHYLHFKKQLEILTAELTEKGIFKRKEKTA